MIMDIALVVGIGMYVFGALFTFALPKAFYFDTVPWQYL